MSMWHFVSGWRSNGRDEEDGDVKQQEVESQQQWERDFEQGDDGIIGDLRRRIRKAQADEHLPPNGVDIRVRDLQYISPPLSTRVHTLPSFIAYHLNIYARIKDRVAPNPAKRRTVLDNINFDIQPGTMTLVIGSPGSGKSSLCKILANQDLNGSIRGQLLCGGQPIQKKDHSHRVAYVRDCDIHIPHLTVKQTFDYADALLTNTNSQVREEKVQAVMEILGLSHRADTIVGDDLTRGVSGGERRRVTVGVELLKHCQLLVMDEATTGLDSTTSLQIFRALRIVADESSPVFATLKQPGKDLYELFDNVLVMHDGQIAYYGPCAEMMDYLESAGFSVNRSINPADEVLSLVDERGDELVETFQRSLEEGHAAEKDDYSTIHGSTSGTVIGKGKAKEPERHMPSDTPQADYPQYARSWLAQYLWTVRRGLQIMKNNPAIAISRVMFAVIMLFVIPLCIVPL